jgi:hypothetical protein
MPGWLALVVVVLGGTLLLLLRPLPPLLPRARAPTASLLTTLPLSAEPAGTSANAAAHVVGREEAWVLWGWPPAQTLPVPPPPPPADPLAGCAALLAHLTVHPNATLGRGTVKEVYVGTWRAAPAADERVAVLRLRTRTYQGDYASGLSRLWSAMVCA